MRSVIVPDSTSPRTASAVRKSARDTASSVVVARARVNVRSPIQAQKCRQDARAAVADRGRTRRGLNPRATDKGALWVPWGKDREAEDGCVRASQAIGEAGRRTP